ncbi:hypothetical protein R3P38DRAFT_2828920 [Favolaschia claudopus]|uniref:BAH domain-containing protein n=1 Tax=Favolaschia claudopus TaxID=2862362 RepID=A0AAW0E9H4_9AGAR
MSTSRQKKRKPTARARTVPTVEEFAALEPYGHFSVTDDNGEEVRFSLGDTAAVLPHHIAVGTQLPPHKYWVVKILAIGVRHPRPQRKKARLNTIQQQIPEVWVKINWFYSPTEISYKIQGFHASHCSNFERIYSDHSDIVSALTFEALAPTTRFREDDPDQTPIPADEFFYRYFFKTSSPRYEIYVLHASTNSKGSEVGCFCDCPYNIRDKSPLRIMHMCPRPSCRRFYHRDCLLEHGHWGPTTDPLVHLACSPDSDLLPSKFVEAKPRSKKCRASQHIEPEIPSSLLRLAAQPIVRGAALPALGIVGNAKDVVYARRLVYSAWQGTTVPHTWQDSVDVTTSMVDSVLTPIQLEETGQECALACPKCGGPI